MMPKLFFCPSGRAQHIICVMYKDQCASDLFDKSLNLCIKIVVLFYFMHIYINTSFYFFNKCFWDVNSKSAISFFQPALETPDNAEKINFSGLSSFFDA